MSAADLPGVPESAILVPVPEAEPVVGRLRARLDRWAGRGIPITADLLRNLPGDDALPPHVLDAGIPPCAVTAVDDLNVVMIASVSHLL